MKICFLFNHISNYQILHAVPYAFELSRCYSDQFECIIACSSPEALSYVKNLSTFYPGQKCTYKLLHVPFLYRLLDPRLIKRKFKLKDNVLKANLEFFKKMDAIVSPESKCVKLKTKFGMRNAVIIHTRHGAGDRKGSFNKRLSLCDLVLIPGKKIEAALKREGLLEKGKYVIVGYPKFDVVQNLNKGRKKIFNNENPVVLYNPHFDQNVGSWNRMGLKVMEFFQKHQEYNLILAPHVVLFKRKRRHDAKDPQRYFGLPNVYIDLGSDASISMTYTLSADIYLGDVSSQVYEFLVKPRPCIFLNAHNIKWKDNPYYFHWNLGQVINNVDELGRALEQAQKLQLAYEKRQIEVFNYTFFDEDGSTAAERGAKAIAEFLQSHTCSRSSSY